jgi:hypothetical protein
MQSSTTDICRTVFSRARMESAVLASNVSAQSPPISDECLALRWSRGGASEHVGTRRRRPGAAGREARRGALQLSLVGPGRLLITPGTRAR